jgi:hypothetical protein
VHSSQSEDDYPITARLKIADPPHGEVEGEYVLPLHADSSGLVLRRVQRRRLEAVVNGQRYRYAGILMVPIDSSEAVVESEIEKPTVLYSEPAVCTTCAGADPDTVRLLVIVGHDGRVREVKMPFDHFPRNAVDRQLTQPSDEVAAAAREAVLKWMFRPARAKGRPVVDWQWADVEVRRQP